MVSAVAVIATTIILTPEQVQLANEQILELGHDKWIAKVKQEGDGTFGSLAEAEKQFTMALTIRNEATMRSRSDLETTKEIQMLMSNLCKGSCRVGDYLTYEKEYGSYYNAKAGSQLAIAIDNYLADRSPVTKMTQQEVWQEYNLTKEIQASNEANIAAFSGRSGGYTFKQHMNEYNSVAYFSSRIFTAAKNSTLKQKQNLFFFANQMIQITKGKDPMPD